MRLLRSAAFTAVCVVLAALGHWFAGGASPGIGTALVSAGAVMTVTVVLAGRERSPAVVVGLLVAAQLILHELFAAPAGPPHAHVLSVDVGMLLCHGVAAAITGWVLARGETALWSVVRLRRRPPVPDPAIRACPTRNATTGRDAGVPPRAAVRSSAPVRRPAAWSSASSRFLNPRPSTCSGVSGIPHTKVESSMSVSIAGRRTGIVAAAAFAVVLGLAVPALAHVTIQPGTAEKGGFTKIAFRVPNERDDASTTKLEVTFPTDTPLPFVSVKPIPGWDTKLTEGKLPKPVVSDDGDSVDEAVLKITWTGGKIAPGEFQEFEVSVGPLPEDVDQIVFPTEQTYSSGEVVKWADAPAADGSEAEHPAPVLKLVAPTGEDDHHGTAAVSPSAAPTTAAPSVSPAAASDHDTAAASSSSDGTARLLGGLGIAVGVVGAAIGVLGLRRSRAQ
ncbi:YcnI family protein [Acrocarpospora corrugata]|uniref:YcnI family copper-binding membrane protein n=1 Tax=Acrocarpospora corrugata TaxID=35763 RepID=UPI001FEC0792|nr:YcnI family protein [Acrocarpospora corrugata]